MSRKRAFFKKRKKILETVLRLVFCVTLSGVTKITSNSSRQTNNQRVISEQARKLAQISRGDVCRSRHRPKGWRHCVAMTGSSNVSCKTNNQRVILSEENSPGDCFRSRTRPKGGQGVALGSRNESCYPFSFKGCKFTVESYWNSFVDPFVAPLLALLRLKIAMQSFSPTQSSTSQTALRFASLRMTRNGVERRSPPVPMVVSIKIDKNSVAMTRLRYLFHLRIVSLPSWRISPLNSISSSP